MAHRKANLPEKTCAACGRPFAWRKKWARDWEDVRYCSDACREGRHPAARGRGGEGGGGAPVGGAPVGGARRGRRTP